jgi:hypothetical protein
MKFNFMLQGFGAGGRFQGPEGVCVCVCVCSRI